MAVEESTVGSLDGDDIVNKTNIPSLHSAHMTVHSSVAAVQPPTCGRCGVSAGIDLKVLDCGCYLHVRCAPVSRGKQLTECPSCGKPSRCIYIIPMSFTELDEARKTAAAVSISGKREKKRKTATIARLNPEMLASGSKEESGIGSDDLRTGRWTGDEMAYCDKLIAKFETGELPVSDGVKLNDFLSMMLKSKQSRLTKKMKNAKLSARSFKRTSGYILNNDDARQFSQLEDAFYRSISCSMERAEIRFHLQKEWRELFSSYCVNVGQKLECDDWLNSVEEMDRRASRAKDAAKMARRKRMMGYALQQDTMHAQQGIFIESSRNSLGGDECGTETDTHDLMTTLGQRCKRQRGITGDIPGKEIGRTKPPPFLGRLVAYMERHAIPFEYVDAWVPSFINNDPQNGQSSPNQKCRLCFAGCATVDTEVGPEGQSSLQISREELFDLNAFGDYSQKFSFDVGCGLPGRVYHTGVASWEQSVHNAPPGHFERCGGAVQWSIKTVLGVPIPSPNVGRIVILLYSRHDRPQNPDMVSRLIDEMTKLLPSPKWKLVVDVGSAPAAAQGNTSKIEASSTTKQEISRSTGDTAGTLLKLLTELMPTDPTSPLAAYLPGFTSLRMMLLKSTRSPHESELVDYTTQSFASYLTTGRSQSDIALLVVREFLAMSQKVQTQPLVHAIPSQVTQHSHHHQQQQQFQHQVQQQQQYQQAPQAHQLPPQQIGIPHGVADFGSSTGVVSVEPTPVSQMRAVPNGTIHHTQQQQQQQAQHYQQMSTNQNNAGQNQQFLSYNSSVK